MMVVSMFSACAAPGNSQPDASDEAVSDQITEDAAATPELNTDLVVYNDASLLSEGPNGEVAEPINTLVFTDEEKAKIAQGEYKAAIISAGSGEWYGAIERGAEAQCEALGIDVVFTSECNFDPAQQATDVESALALTPDILITLPVDPVSAAQALQPAVEKGVKIVLMDNGVNGYTPGKEYVAIVTGDQWGMGRAAAQLISEAVDGSGKIGMIWYDADYFITNNRDNKFEETIKTDYPDIEIASKQGFTDENATGDVASAMLLQNSDLEAIYCSWDVAAEGVISTLRSMGREDIKVVTMDLGATNDLDMATGGILYGTTCDMPYDEGAAMITIAASSLIGKEVGTFYTSGLLTVTADNLMDSWYLSLRKDVPDNIKKILE
jgi:ribose transport system substrate-binding protein